MSYTIESTKPSVVKVHEFPTNTKHVSYNIYSNGRSLELNFYVENVEPQKNFWNSDGESFRFDDNGHRVNENTEGAVKLQFDLVLNIMISINSDNPMTNLCLGSEPKIYGHSFDLSEDGDNILLTDRYGISNTYDGFICWGYGEIPLHRQMSPIGIINNFVGKPFNNDYCSLQGFYDGALKAKSKTPKSKIQNYYGGHRVLCSGYDAIMLLDAKQHPDSFFRMLCAGFRGCEESSTLMMIPLIKTTITHNDVDHDGYFTPMDATGKNWFITNTGLMIGQMDT